MSANKNDLPMTAVSARLVKEVEEVTAAKATGRLVLVMHYKDGHLKAADFARTSRISREQNQREAEQFDALETAFQKPGRAGEDSAFGLVDCTA